MANIQVKNIPEKLHNQLRRYARKQECTLGEIDTGPGSGLSIDLLVTTHRGQSLIFASIVDSLMPTISLMPRIERSR